MIKVMIGDDVITVVVQQFSEEKRQLVSLHGAKGGQRLLVLQVQTFQIFTAPVHPCRWYIYVIIIIEPRTQIKYLVNY